MMEPLHRVVVRRPNNSFGNANPSRWHYVSQPDLSEAQQEPLTHTIRCMLKRRLKDAGLSEIFSPHSFRVLGSPIC